MYCILFVTISSHIQEVHMSFDSDFFPKGNAAHERYKFGSLKVGGKTIVDLSETHESSIKIRGHISAHCQYHNKKFKTKCHNGKMYIMRIA